MTRVRRVSPHSLRLGTKSPLQLATCTRARCRRREWLPAGVPTPMVRRPCPQPPRRGAKSPWRPGRLTRAPFRRRERLLAGAPTPMVRRPCLQPQVSGACCCPAVLCLAIQTLTPRAPPPFQAFLRRPLSVASASPRRAQPVVPAAPVLAPHLPVGRRHLLGPSH